MAHRFLDERSHDDQRRALHAALGPSGLAHLIDGGKVDPVHGRRIGKTPPATTPRARSVDVIRRDPATTDEPPAGTIRATPAIGELTTVYVDDEYTGDDRLRSPDEAAAEREARRLEDEDAERWAALPASERARRDADAIAQAAKGAKRIHGAGGGDKGPKPRSTRGKLTEKVAHENWDHERSVGGRPRKGHDVRERFSVRAEPEVRATIAQTGRTESDFIAEAAKLVAMARTGAQADELMLAVIKLAGTTAAA